MADPQISEIWTARIYYRGKTGRSKLRPVLVLNVEDSGHYTIQEITSEGPKTPPKFFDGFKELIEKWNETEVGLEEKSYVKCSPTNTHKFERIRLKEYVGIMDESDFEKIINKIVESQGALNNKN